MEESPRSESSARARLDRFALPLVSCVACALFVAGVLLFYFGPSFASYLNSDAAVPVLLADEVLRTGRPVPSTWFFANDEIWTLAPHLFAMPFVVTIGISTLALKLGNLLCLFLSVTLLALSLHRVTRSLPFATLVAAGVFAPFSRLQEGAVYSQVAYGWFTAQFALLIYLALRIQDERAPEPWRFFGVPWTYALYALLLVALATDSPMRAGAYWLVPFVAVALTTPVSKARSRWLAAVTIFACCAGAAIHHVISKYVLTDPGLTAGLIKPIGEWPGNLMRLWVGLPQLTGWTGSPYASPAGFVDRARFCTMFCAGLIVLIAPVGSGPCSAECRFFARVSGAMLLVALIALAVGRLNADPSSDRYLISPALLSLAAFMAILWCRLRARTWTIAAFAAAFVLMFSGAAVMRISRFGSIAFDNSCDAAPNVCRLESALAKTGVRRGYASYWKGNVTTLVSDGDVRVCAVWLMPHLAPFRWLATADCLDAPPEDRFFLALDKTEIATSGRESLETQAGKPDRVVTADEYEIWIYTTADAKLDWLQRRR